VREEAADTLLQTMSKYAPNVPGSIRHRFVESPLDLERRMGVLKGNPIHVDLSPNQMLFFRPLPELAQYRTPVPGLYLASAGSHPVGGVTGMPGYNAARAILSDRRATRRRLWALGGLGALLTVLAARRWRSSVASPS